MVQACIQIELSEGQWKMDVSRKHADASFQLLSTMLAGDHAIETVVVSGRAMGECLSAIDAHPDIKVFEVVDQRETTATVQLETLEPTVFSAAARAKTPLVYPVRVKRGELTATVVGTRAAVSSLGDQLRADGLGFEVASIQSDHSGSQILTDRQEEVLFTAIERGYYNSPRECTLTGVAEELEIAKSTCSAMLQRAEGAIIEYFCSQQQRPEPVSVETPSTTSG
jgi:predicted DNA binding protein